jgi:hypothetical protein
MINDSFYFTGFPLARQPPNMRLGDPGTNGAFDLRLRAWGGEERGSGQVCKQESLHLVLHLVPKLELGDESKKNPNPAFRVSNSSLRLAAKGGPFADETRPQV